MGRFPGNTVGIGSFVFELIASVRLLLTMGKQRSAIATAAIAIMAIAKGFHRLRRFAR